MNKLLCASVCDFFSFNFVSKHVFNSSMFTPYLNQTISIFLKSSRVKLYEVRHYCVGIVCHCHILYVMLFLVPSNPRVKCYVYPKTLYFIRHWMDCLLSDIIWVTQVSSSSKMDHDLFKSPKMPYALCLMFFGEYLLYSVTKPPTYCIFAIKFTNLSKDF